MLRLPEELISDDWCTPKALALRLGRFDTDPCSNPYSHIQADKEYWLERGQNGLLLPWIGRAWWNPPYSDPLPWCQRAVSRRDGSSIGLLKNDMTTEWFETLYYSRPQALQIRGTGQGVCHSAVGLLARHDR